jgi:hypothetical protein
MKKAFIAVAVWVAAFSLSAVTHGAPKIQFDSTTFDFGKTSQVEKVSGIFTFKNAGDAVLKVEQPKPSCGCTVASLKKDTLQPGETSELPFTLNLGHARGVVQKSITVISNDPTTPQVSLTVKADYTPLYVVSTSTLQPNVPLGGETNMSFTLSRTDGKPLGSAKFMTSKPWVTAKVASGSKPDDSSAMVSVTVRPDGLPRRFNEYIQIYGGDQTNGPISTVWLYGRILGDLTLTPETFYWSVTDRAKTIAEKPEATITRRVMVRANKEVEFAIKNIHSSISGIQVEALPREMKKATQPGKPDEVEKYFELVAKMTDVPEKTVTGTVTFETTLAAQPKVELPVTIYVFNKK